jgi:hypothetical protein
VRWLVCQPGPAFSVHDVHVGWCEALRELGQDVHEFNLDERLAFFGSALKETREPGMFARSITPAQAYEMAADTLYSALYQTWPDVLLVISGFFIPTAILDRARRTRTRVVIVHTESPYEDERQLTLAQFADLNLINDPTNIERFPPGTRYVPHAYRPSLHHPGPGLPEMICDFAFVGTGYQSRIDFFGQMDFDGLDAVLGGNWTLLPDDHPLRKCVAHDIEHCLDNEKTAALYRSARVGMNLYRREAQQPELSTGWAMGPREVEMAACGLFFLRDSRPEGDEVLSMLPTFTSPDEASELLRWWLDHPDERGRLTRQARAAVADRTFITHAKSLLRLLG